ncbi:hypothetical protein Vadar_014867 [Vaccinium darrowii]|uniref:Uncharacterized protein n=1 Tax=Vaccinium darrowii TaxID=229202 RepID=A0ACB7ZBU2_9ERIC|nr:hypothetical protein Vadar_014867 [Vaccinium darrowii]
MMLLLAGLWNHLLSALAMCIFCMLYVVLSRHLLVKQQRVTIQNSHGEKLVGIMHETGSTEIVIVCHGFRSSKDRIPMTNLAIALGKGGISAFRFDFAGNGESEGVFRYGSYHREADDLRTIVQYFCGEKRSIAAIIGHSKGGNVVLLYASVYNDVRYVVNLSGRFDLKRGIEGRLGKDFLERIKKNGFIHVKNRRGKLEYCVTEESLMDRLTTDMHAACLSIPHSCSRRCQGIQQARMGFSMHSRSIQSWNSLNPRMERMMKQSENRRDAGDQSSSKGTVENRRDPALSLSLPLPFHLPLPFILDLMSFGRRREDTRGFGNWRNVGLSGLWCNGGCGSVGRRTVVAILDGGGG